MALSLWIGLAKRAYDRDPDAARELLDDAQEQAEQALAELRHVVRGIRPPLLTDRDLIGAVHAPTAGTGLWVTVEVEVLADEGARAAAAVEAAARFMVAEALTNVAKHSGMSEASARIDRMRRGLRIEVADAGRGGADESGGSGLLGHGAGSRRSTAGCGSRARPEGRR